MFFGGLTIATNGFSMVFDFATIVSMVFDGSGPLVKRCDGFDGSLWSNCHAQLSIVNCYAQTCLSMKVHWPMHHPCNAFLYIQINISTFEKSLLRSNLVGNTLYASSRIKSGCPRICNFYGGLDLYNLNWAGNWYSYKRVLG